MIVLLKSGDWLVLYIQILFCDISDLHSKDLSHNMVEHEYFGGTSCLHLHPEDGDTNIISCKIKMINTEDTKHTTIKLLTVWCSPYSSDLLSSDFHLLPSLKTESYVEAAT
jgi:hypothetical protein